MRVSKKIGVSIAAMASALGLTAMGAPRPTYAQEAQGLRSFDIPAQDLESALQAFASQTDRNVLFTPDMVEGKQSRGAQGQMTERQALEALLAGTDLQFEQTASNGYAVQVPNSPTRLGAANGAAPSDADRGDAYSEILVLGRRSLNADIRRSEDDAQPYVVFDRTEIERSGASTLEDFFRSRVTADAQGVTAARQGDINNASIINLRGLGAAQTLILVDGRRVASWNRTGFPQQPDLNGIPLAAIQRIEVLPTTASGIYGGSATGGVINIVLRRDFSGVETTATYNNTFDTDSAQSRIDVGMGHSIEAAGTTVLFSGSYSRANPLLASDRDFSDNARDHILAVNPGRFYNSATPVLGATTNIRSLNGSNLTLKPAFGGTALGSPITFIPYGYAGAASDNGAGLVANAGHYNFDLANTAASAGAGRYVLNTPEIWSADLTIRKDFNDWLQGFMEFAAAQNNSEFARQPVQ